MDPLRKTFNPNKQLKEEFVSNLTGSSILEIAALSAIVPILMLLRRSISSKSINDILRSTGFVQKKNDDATVYHKDMRSYMVTLTMDFLYIILPILSIFTVLAEWTYVCAVCLILLLLLSIIAERFMTSKYSKEGVQPISSLRMNISSYRVSMMIVTCLCILAVDFKIYPRRYAKTETYGTGLMDLGVGSFVLANSFVSKQARNATSVGWKASLQSVSPLLLLGFGRLIFTARVDYQVHVGEYGVHWNFFFTLAAISILTSIIRIHPQYCGIIGSSLLIGYQICLLCGLNEYLISNKREMNIISQNKEGIFSIFGYWGMYLVGIQLANHLFFGNTTANKMRSVQWTRIRVWALAVLFWSITIILDKHVERISRRMCNLAYVTFVFAQNFQVLAILMLSDFIPGPKTSILEEAFNRNLLGSFVLANVLTGVINLYVDTLSASSLSSFSILVGYAFVLSVLSGIATFTGFKLKFW
ncbi:transferases, transferring acyl groups [Tasmannia lanceolata]|uniref:transferases, transferring acyl groups n=1 Tax=Tasmannia lanceolata TaxID=3420 RepID=UPI004062F7DD